MTDRPVLFLYQSWRDLDAEVEGLSAEELAARYDGRSAIAWTFGHVAGDPIHWLNRVPQTRWWSAHCSDIANEADAAAKAMKAVKQGDRRIRVITFDGDGTLWDFVTAMRSALGECLAEIKTVHPNHGQGLTVADMIQIREDVARRWPPPRGLPLSEIRLKAFEAILESIDVPDAALARSLCEKFLKRRLELLTPFSDAVAVVPSLGKSFKLGIISNGNAFIDQVNMPFRVEFALYAERLGRWKPAREIFELALERAACQPEELLHVGDSYEEDVLGAERIGAIGVFLNRDQADRAGEARYQIRTLSELPDLIERLRDE